MFKPSRELLNVNFEGYKLSQNRLGIVNKQLPSTVKVVQLKDEDFSYQHIKAHTLHNHLHFDPSDASSVYWCAENGSIVKSSVVGDSLTFQTVLCFSGKKELKHSTNPTIAFLSRNVGVVCDGGSEVGVFTREMSSASENWTIVRHFPSVANPVLILTADTESEGTCANVLCAELCTPTSSGEPIAVVKWYQIVFKVDISQTKPQTQDIGEVSLLSTFRTESLPFYSTFQSSSKEVELLFMSETTPLVADTCTSNKISSDRDNKLTEEPDRHYGLGYDTESYQWNQNETEVVISFQLSQDVGKRDISCVLETGQIVVGLTDGTTLLRGELTHKIDPEASTWTIQDHLLEVTLEKKTQGIEWKYITKSSHLTSTSDSHLPLSEGLDDEITPEELEKAKKMLAASKDEKQDDCDERQGPVVPTALEECDSSDEDPVIFVISEQGSLKERIGLGGRQLVFTAPSPSGRLPCFALRHDVDAVVWRPHTTLSSSSSKSRWTHTATFNALGYVQASKRERKFTTCSQDMRFAVISDCTSHVFVYMQPEKSHPNTAEEYVFSFTRPAQILGVVATDTGAIFMLTDKELNVAMIPQLSDS